MDIFDNILISDKTPSILYHYTSQKGLLGIINSRALWATNIRYINNNSDQTYVINMVQQELKHQIQKLEVKQEESGELDKTITPIPENNIPNAKQCRLLKEISDRLNATERYHIFMCSFCQEGDQVAQWRNPNLNGSGYCIGFEPSKLIALAGDLEFKLVKCRQDVSQQVNLVKSLIHEALQKIADLNESSTEWLLTLNNLADEYAIKFVQLSAVFKHPSVDDGTEWRLFSMPFPILPTGSSMGFREGNTMLIPFLECRLTSKKEENLPIKCIIVGPTPHKELSKNAVELLLSARNMKSCQVDFSNIPYGIG